MSVTPEIVAEHGLTADEYALIERIMDRAPNITELGIFSVMWSEHCSYKSSKRWLRELPTEAPWVICGPGENAGVIDIGDGQAAVFKMESHNHPSFIEPYQGAATGVGGILRDVFTMGARPVANMNALRFGATDHAKTRHLVAGVVAGIGGYGNCIGVPTVGGETNFDPAYNGNILVNAMTVGIADADRIFYSAAAGPGNAVVYVGAKTGRDGIHGATMASAEFDDDTEAKRPTVQVGDPFTEKLLLEACLELMATDAIVAIQDMGAAGLTSSSVEMSSKGGVGVELDLDAVPVREAGMTPYEIMLSESQERMLMVIRPEREDMARAVFEKWELDFSVIGRITESGRLVLRMAGETVADIEVAPLVENAPEYDRPWTPAPPPAEMASPASAAGDMAPTEVLARLMATPDLASRRWIWEQYDHMVMGDTVARPGGDAAIVRVHGTRKGLAITTDCTPRYCEVDPVEGGRQAVAEACRVLDFPVVSGNVSLYNETDGRAIRPAPVIGGVGLIDDIANAASLAFEAGDQAIVVIGETRGHVAMSLYMREFAGADAGAPPPVDLAAERRNGDFVRARMADGLVSACHDVSDGGLLVAVAEMALAGDVGADIAVPDGERQPLDWLFGEDQGRYVIQTADAEAVLEAASGAGIPAIVIGGTGGTSLTVAGQDPISVSTLREAHEGWLPAYMATP